MSHANAALTPIQQLRIGNLIVDEGWPVTHAAVFFHVSWQTAKRWADRHAAGGGRTCRTAPHARTTAPRKPRPPWCEKSCICAGRNASDQSQSGPA
ncbi:MAG: family transposase [Micrococcaceae bacterium]|nr:family transposase [Micrococcaceae bacterium]